jgi:hypothetical protein
MSHIAPNGESEEIKIFLCLIKYEAVNVWRKAKTRLHVRQYTQVKGKHNTPCALSLQKEIFVLTGLETWVSLRTNRNEMKERKVYTSRRENYPHTIFKIQNVRKILYPFVIFFLGAQCVESGASCTDCY